MLLKRASPKSLAVHFIFVDIVMRITYKRVSFPDSSAVESVTVNHLVGGSNPSQGAKV